MAQRITIIVDENGEAEIRSPVDMSDDEVLDILTQAIDAASDKLLAVEETRIRTEEDVPGTTQFPLPHTIKYLN